jgi:hypothetical protein
VFSFFVSKQKKDVEIREGKEHPPSVPAEREKAQSLGCPIVDAQQFTEHLLDVPVRQFAQRAQRFSRTRTHLKLLTDALTFRLGLRPKHG